VIHLHPTFLEEHSTRAVLLHSSDSDRSSGSHSHSSQSWCWRRGSGLSLLPVAPVDLQGPEEVGSSSTDSSTYSSCLPIRFDPIPNRIESSRYSIPFDAEFERLLALDLDPGSISCGHGNWTSYRRI